MRRYRQGEGFYERLDQPDYKGWSRFWRTLKLVAIYVSLWLGAGLIGYLLMSSPILSALTGINR